MRDLSAMIWVEARKALRSRIPLWTALGAIWMPVGLGCILFAATHPELSHSIGLISAKANLMAYASMDWASYLALAGQLLAGGGFFFFVVAVSWIFGREFVDGTLKELLAVLVSRSSVILAKFLVMLIWSAALSGVLFLGVLVMGLLINLPGGAQTVLRAGVLRLGVTASLAMLAALPFGFLASVGRGYLAPLVVAVLTLILTNLIALAGWGDYFPWAIPGLYAQGASPLPPLSYGISALTGLAGIVATDRWWRWADQSR
ncbi:MAG: ABC transporter permease subunit [Chloroflexales bacterium]|nr:ABC transporter permease subunit [Chloroflexales bacterium]